MRQVENTIDLLPNGHFILTCIVSYLLVSLMFIVNLTV